MAISPKNTYNANQVDASDLANYPEGKAKNISAIGNTDGTPYEEKIVNDLFGFQQAILRQSLQAVSGLNDTASLSQYLQGIKLICGTKADNIFQNACTWVPVANRETIYDVANSAIQSAGIGQIAYSITHKMAYVNFLQRASTGDTQNISYWPDFSQRVGATVSDLSDFSGLESIGFIDSNSSLSIFYPLGWFSSDTYDRIYLTTNGIDFSQGGQFNGTTPCGSEISFLDGEVKFITFANNRWQVSSDGTTWIDRATVPIVPGFPSFTFEDQSRYVEASGNNAVAFGGSQQINSDDSFKGVTTDDGGITNNLISLRDCQRVSGTTTTASGTIAFGIPRFTTGSPSPTSGIWFFNSYGGGNVNATTVPLSELGNEVQAVAVFPNDLGQEFLVVRFVGNDGKSGSSYITTNSFDKWLKINTSREDSRPSSSSQYLKRQVFTGSNWVFQNKISDVFVSGKTFGADGFFDPSNPSIEPGV